jgi:adenylate kinase
MGPPGAGKGTQARVIAECLGLLHIDCGRLIRQEVADETELGGKAKEHMLAGRLVPDELIIGMMLKRLDAPDSAKGFLLDGFPRTLEQVEGLEKYLADKDERLDYVIYLGVSEETAVKRLSSRQYCPSCGMVFNLLTAPPEVEGVCDKCAGKLEQRGDDKPETVLERLDVYEEETAPLREYYEKADGYLEINGDKSSDEVSEEILAAIKTGGRCN